MQVWDAGQYLRFADEQRVFLDRYVVARLADAFPARADGKVLLPYPRLFFIASPR
jgi:trans-aconitate 2-methyltransferase